jgi:hypothetical protein
VHEHEHEHEHGLPPAARSTPQGILVVVVFSENPLPIVGFSPLTPENAAK